MTLDPVLNAPIWTLGDIAKAAGMPNPAVKRLVAHRVLRPKSGGKPGHHFTFTIVDAIAAAVAAIFGEAKLGRSWVEGASHFVASLSAEEITAACNEGLIGIVPTNKTLTKWVLEEIASDLPAGQRSLCERLSLKAAVDRTNRGIKRMLESRAAARTGRPTGLEKALS